MPSPAGVWVGESSPLLAVWFDQDMKVLGASRLFLTRTGYTREQLVGRPFVSLFGEAPRASGSGRGDLTEVRTFRELTAQLRAANGSLIEALWSTQIDRAANGTIVGGAAYFVDVTAQRRAEQALSARERELTMVFNGSRDLMALLRVEAGPTFRYVQVNRTYLATSQRFGYRLSADDLEGRTVQEILTAFRFDSQRLAFVLGRYRAVWETRKVVTYPETLSTPAGVFHAEMVLSPIFDDDGEVSHVLFVARDVTEEKRIEAQLLLADRMVSMGTMAAGVAHEINNPLSYVAGNVTYCQQRLAELADAVPAARAVVEQLLPALEDAAGGAARVATIVQDLRLFSRSEDVPAGPVVLSSVIHSVLRMLHAEIEHRAKVVLDFQTVPSVRGTEARLGQVFTNLFVNAVQAMPIRSAEENVILVRLRNGRSGEVIAEVCDNGPGVPPEVRGRIFDLFFTTKPVGLGTGLGLSICHRIVTSFGGTIELDTDAGRGATFRVTLRAWEERVMPDQSMTSSDSSRGPSAQDARPRVIVLDDDMVVRRVLARLLRDRFDVIVEADPETVLGRFRHGETADAILCDVIMPGLSGMDFYRRLAEIEPRLLSRCIFMTGGAVSDQMQSFLESLPAERILEKPFHPPRLFLLLEELVREQRGA